MSKRAEFSVTTAQRVEFVASWPQDADADTLRRVAASLPTILEWWANELSQKVLDAAEAEYASWLPAPARGAEGRKP